MRAHAPISRDGTKAKPCSFPVTVMLELQEYQSPEYGSHQALPTLLVDGTKSRGHQQAKPHV
jgi:hypothetical protein